MSTTPPPSRRRGQVAIALTVALLGFLLATQLRAQQGLAQRLQIERESDLAQILTQLQDRSDQLQGQIEDLRVRLAGASDSNTRQQVLLSDARKHLAALKILLGVVPVKGEGIAIAVADPKSTIGPDVLLDTIQELRDAGAEAIAVNDIRVVDRTSFAGSPGALVVGGRRVRAPYAIEAVGPSQTLAEAMRIPGGVVDSIATRDGASVRITPRDQLRITATRSAPRFRYARPGSRR